MVLAYGVEVGPCGVASLARTGFLVLASWASVVAVGWSEPCVVASVLQLGHLRIPVVLVDVAENRNPFRESCFLLDWLCSGDYKRKKVCKKTN